MLRVLAIGFDPAYVDLLDPNLTPALIRAFIDAQLDRLAASGYEVHSCLVGSADAAEGMVSACLGRAKFDCVVFGAGLRTPEQLLLFEKLINVVHTMAPMSRICFNTTPADTTEAVQRWI
jgi:hypothetical protein